MAAMSCHQCGKLYDAAKQFVTCPHDPADLETGSQSGEIRRAIGHLNALLDRNDRNYSAEDDKTYQDCVDRVPSFGFGASHASHGLIADEIDTIRCAINRLIKAATTFGPESIEIDKTTWEEYKSKLEYIREKIRIGPPDERSDGR